MLLHTRYRVLALLLIALAVLPWSRVIPSPDILYVATSGRDANSGHSPAAPLRTIQAAINAAGPGDTIVVGPGTYPEWLRIDRGGRSGAPLTLRAEPPGGARITGQASREAHERFAWRDEGDGVWSTATAWPVYHLRLGDENAYHLRWGKDKPGHLRRLAARSGHGTAFGWQNGRLYVVPSDGSAASLADVRIHRQVLSPFAYWGMRATNLEINAGHIEIDGFVFDFGVGAGIDLWHASEVRIRNSAFTGATVGIRAFHDVRDLSVERSLYHNGPQADWEGWLSWREIYAHHAESSLIRASADGVSVRDNLVYHAGDGIAVSTSDTPERGPIVISGNLVLLGTDDALELDGQGEGVDVTDNLLGMFHASVSLSPLQIGPVSIHANLLFDGWDERDGTHLKFTANEGDSVNRVAISDNLLLGKTLFYGEGPFRDVEITDNRFVHVLDYFDEPLPGMRWARNEILNRDLHEDCARIERRLAAGLTAAGPAWRTPEIDRMLIGRVAARLACPSEAG